MVVETYTFTNLGNEKYIRLTTFRKTGETVITPMWFAESKEIIYVGTGVNARSTNEQVVFCRQVMNELHSLLRKD
jgi:hypothetical protein